MIWATIFDVLQLQKINQWPYQRETEEKCLPVTNLNFSEAPGK